VEDERYHLYKGEMWSVVVPSTADANIAAGRHGRDADAAAPFL
jgi:hypothetical protein